MRDVGEKIRERGRLFFEELAEEKLRGGSGSETDHRLTEKTEGRSEREDGGTERERRRSETHGGLIERDDGGREKSESSTEKIE